MVIVYDKETLPMANSLFNKIKEKGYSCVTWSEEQYHNQKPGLENDESQNKILFLAKKCVREVFSNPSLKPLLVNENCRIFHEGINAGIGLVSGATVDKVLSEDKFLKWTYGDDKKWKKWVFGAPAQVWSMIRAVDTITSPLKMKKLREMFYWTGVDIFYDNYIDAFMEGKELLPINGITSEDKYWQTIRKSLY